MERPSEDVIRQLIKKLYGNKVLTQNELRRARAAAIKAFTEIKTKEYNLDIFSKKYSDVGVEIITIDQNTEVEFSTRKQG